MTTPEQRLANAFDAIAPSTEPVIEGVVPYADSLTDPVQVLIDGKTFDELPPEFFTSAASLIGGTKIDKRPDLEAVKAAIMDVMLGPVVDVSGRRAHTGINTYIRHDIPVPKIRLIGWQDQLNKVLEQL